MLLEESVALRDNFSFPCIRCYFEDDLKLMSKVSLQSGKMPLFCYILEIFSLLFPHCHKSCKNTFG